MGAILLSVAVIGSLGLSRLTPPAPDVERSAVMIDRVKRGPMLREVRGLGKRTRAIANELARRSKIEERKIKSIADSIRASWTALIDRVLTADPENCSKTPPPQLPV